jgi:hypothetical protein
MGKKIAIPAFDQLLPEPHGTIVHQLLFVLAEWHALAKLRMHTELTVNLLEAKTEDLASSVCAFMEVTCAAYKTVETTKEYAARLKRSAKKARESDTTHEAFGRKDTGTASSHAEATAPPPAPVTTLQGTDANRSIASSHAQAEASTPPSILAATTRQGRLQKTLNIQTYKYHALADYAEHIRRFGTTDSYSTERVSPIFGSNARHLVDCFSG